MKLPMRTDKWSGGRWGKSRAWENDREEALILTNVSMEGVNMQAYRYKIQVILYMDMELQKWKHNESRPKGR